MKGRFAEKQVEERCIVRLYHKEEDLFYRYVEQLGSNDYMRWIGPDVGAD